MLQPLFSSEFKLAVRFLLPSVLLIYKPCCIYSLRFYHTKSSLDISNNIAYTTTLTPSIPSHHSSKDILATKRTPLPTLPRSLPSSNDIMSTPGTPLPTMPRAPGDDEKETRVKPATGLGAKRTPLPTGRPVQNDAGSTTDNVVKQQLPAQRLPVRKSHQGGFDEVDLTQHPALKSATGVVRTYFPYYKSN